MLTDKNIPDTSFYVKAVKKPKKGTLAKQSVVMYVPDGVKFPAEGGGGGTSDFNELEHRPKYNGSPMTGSTNIPEVKPVMKTLTEADFNWNSQTHSSSGELDGIAAWLLPDGFYTVDGSTPELAQKIWLRDSSGIEAVLGVGFFYYVKHIGEACIITYVTRQTEGGGVSSIYTGIPRIGRVIVPDISNPSDNTKKFTCSGVEDIVDNLTDDSSYKTLSANQGKVLKDLIDSLVISGSSAPTTATVGTVGQLYEDTTNGKLYQCTAVSGGVYTWVEVGGGSGGGNITFYISYDDVPHSTGVNIRDKNIYADAGLTTPISAMDLRDALDSNNTVNFVLIDLVNGGFPIKCAFKNCDIPSAEDLENYSGMTVYIDGAFDGGYYQCYFEGPDPGVFGFTLFQ